MCEYVDIPSVAPGFACCFCHSYNALHYGACKCCRRWRCNPLTPDRATGEKYETLEELASTPKDPPRLTLLETLSGYV